MTMYKQSKSAQSLSSNVGQWRIQGRSEYITENIYYYFEYFRVNPFLSILVLKIR